MDWAQEALGGYGQPYVSEDDTALFEYLELVVIVDTELREENLILIGGQCPLARPSAYPIAYFSEGTHRQGLFCLGVILTSKLNERPECSVVQVVDVTCLHQHNVRRERVSERTHNLLDANSSSRVGLQC